MREISERERPMPRTLLRLWLLAACLLALPAAPRAQSELLTKTVLDSLQPYKFHGAGNMSFNFSRTTSKSVHLYAGVSFLLPTSRHQFRLNGSFAYNLLDVYSNDNKGKVNFHALINQFYILDRDREKNPWFVDLYASYNYDYIRKLHDRAAAGVDWVWQPLREHPHLSLEPCAGLLFSYQNWMVLGDGSGRGDAAAGFNTLRDSVLSDGRTLGEYYGVDRRGRKTQMDCRVTAGARLIGEWDRISFSSYISLRQPLRRPFRRDAALESEAASLASALTETGASCLPALNTRCAPEIQLYAHFSLKIWKMLSLFTSFELFYDGGQLPSEAMRLTYGIREGLSVVW